MKKAILIVGAILLVAAGIWGFRSYRQASAARAAQATMQTEPIRRGNLVAQVGASGIVRSRQSAHLFWQTSGTIDKVQVAVGERVSGGDVLATLAQSSLAQNVILAQADLVDARKALDDLLNSTLQQAQANKAVEDAQKALDDARTPDLTQAAAQQAVADAQKAVELAETALRSAQTSASQSFIDEAEANVTFAKDRLDRAWEKYKPYVNKPEDNLTRARLLSEYAAAKQAYDFAVRKLNSLQGTASATDLAIRQANLETAQAQLAQAQREWERVKEGPSQAEIAALEAQLADAQRELGRVKDGPDPDDVAAAQAKVAAAEATLNMASIQAPFDGEITRVDSQVGDQVNPSTPAFRLDDLSQLLVDVQVTEVDVNQVQVGQDVALTFDSIPNKNYHGEVIEVAPVGETSITDQVSQGVVDFTVTVKLTDADKLVKPGMTAAVNITVDELQDVILIPNRAVRTKDGKRVVYLLRNGQSVAVPVTLGPSSDTDSELVDGAVKEGDQVLLNPPTEMFSPDSGRGRPGMFGGN